MHRHKPIRPNLIITGFMGTGKTAVGTIVANRLGREFVDMDQVIEERLGLSIPEIFSTQGENFFRQKESELVEELCSSSGKVIATGGGTLIPDANREVMAANGFVVNLRCSPEEILSRLEHQHHRPLLEVGDRLSAMKLLLEKRRTQYDQMPCQIETTTLSADEVAGRVVGAYLLADTGVSEASESERITVDWPYGAHEVIFGRGLIGRLGMLLREIRLGGPIALAAAPLVAGYYGEVIGESLRSSGYDVTLIEVPDGEIHKNLNTIGYLYDRFAEAGIDRSATVITVGGGVLSDTVGFAAATFMRGLPLVHIPTTLLAQVDAGVGGKVAVDHPRGKNLIGAFFAPRLVLIDPFVLRSLPTVEIRAGSAEVVKTAVIRSADLFQRMEGAGAELTDHVIYDAVRIKAEVVSKDPFERGERAILNFGHTVGHAIESVSGYRIRHGEAVSVGMMAATRIAIEMSLCDPSVHRRLGRLLRCLGLPLTIQGFSGDAVWQAMAMDKKKRAGKLRYVLPTEIGRVLVSDDIPEEVVHRALGEVIPAAR